MTIPALRAVSDPPTQVTLVNISISELPSDSDKIVVDDGSGETQVDDALLLTLLGLDPPAGLTRERAECAT